MPATLPIREAATLLGLSLDQARKQVQRGTLPAEKIGNRWYIRLTDAQLPRASETVSDGSETPVSPVSDREVAVLRELIGTLQGELSFLHGELSARTQELRRKDHIIAALTERLPQLSAATHDGNGAVPSSAAPSRARTKRAWWKFWLVS